MFRKKMDKKSEVTRVSCICSCKFDIVKFIDPLSLSKKPYYCPMCRREYYVRSSQTPKVMKVL